MCLFLLETLGYNSGKISGYPAKNFVFAGFRGTYRTFWTPPLHAETPHQCGTGGYPDPKIWFCAPFSCLIQTLSPETLAWPFPPSAPKAFYGCFFRRSHSVGQIKEKLKDPRQPGARLDSASAGVKKATARGERPEKPWNSAGRSGKGPSRGDTGPEKTRGCSSSTFTRSPALPNILSWR